MTAIVLLTSLHSSAFAGSRVSEVKSVKSAVLSTSANLESISRILSSSAICQIEGPRTPASLILAAQGHETSGGGSYELLGNKSGVVATASANVRSAKNFDYYRELILKMGLSGLKRLRAAIQEGRLLDKDGKPLAAVITLSDIDLAERTLRYLTKPGSVLFNLNLDIRDSATNKALTFRNYPKSGKLEMNPLEFERISETYPANTATVIGESLIVHELLSLEPIKAEWSSHYPISAGLVRSELWVETLRSDLDDCKWKLDIEDMGYSNVRERKWLSEKEPTLKNLQADLDDCTWAVDIDETARIAKRNVIERALDEFRERVR